jgi:hypothetical protein
MPGLVPGIHVLLSVCEAKTWMAGTSPAMTNGAYSFCCYSRLMLVISLPAALMRAMAARVFSTAVAM